MNSNNAIPKSRKLVYWVTTAIIAVIYFITGLGNILPFNHIAQDMAQLGYPIYFLKIIGTWKILAAISLIIPGNRRVKEWAYAGMMFDLTGAAASRYFAGNPIQMIIIPIGISALVTVNYVVRRSLQGAN